MSFTNRESIIFAVNVRYTIRKRTADKNAFTANMQIAELRTLDTKFAKCFIRRSSKAKLSRFIKGVKMMIREIAKYTIGLLVAFGMLFITGYGV